MSKYLALVRKQDFSDLYQYGEFHANRDLVIEVTGNVDHIKSCPNYFKNITAFANSFDSTFTYLFVLYEKTNTNSRFCDVEIENVLNLFPLDNEAKTILEEDFGKQIRFEEPLWPEAIKQLKVLHKVADCNKGVRNLWSIYGLDDNLFYECKEIIPDSVINEVITEKFQNIHPIGDLPIWVYLLRYERHSMYPNTTLGFYMDAVHAATNYSQRKEFFSIEASFIYQFLNSMDYNSTTKQIFTAVNNSPKTRKFVEFSENLIEGCDFMTVATIFFRLKNDNKDHFSYNQKFITALKESCPKEFALATYLLGWVLGHEKTFDYVYEKLPLKIFNRQVSNLEPASSPISEKTLTEQEPPKSLPNEEPSLFKTEENDDVIKFPVKMGKLIVSGKNKGKIASKPKPKMVGTIELFKKLKSEGWIIITE